MRLPNTPHTPRPWRIRELTRDFRLEDVLLEEVLPEFVVHVFIGSLRRDFLYRIARLAEGSA